MDIPADVLEQLKCHQCDMYLSWGPVYLEHGGAAACGRCFSPKRPATRNKEYEAVAKLLRFPCKNQDLGCGETVGFEEVAHEARCSYRQYVCPVLGSSRCEWLGTRSQLLQHCQEQHPDNVLDNPCSLTHDITTSSLHNYVLQAFQLLFLLLTKVCVTSGRIYHSVCLLDRDDMAKDFTYTLHIKRNKEEITKTGDVEPQGCLALQEPTALGLDTNSLLSVLGGWGGVSCTVEVEWRHTDTDQSWGQRTRERESRYWRRQNPEAEGWQRPNPEAEDWQRQEEAEDWQRQGEAEDWQRQEEVEDWQRQEEAEDWQRQGEAEDWQRQEEVEDWQRQGEAEDWQRQEEVEDWQRQEEAEDWQRQGEAEDWQRQEEAEDWQRQGEAEDWQRQEEVEDWQRQEEAEDWQRQEEAEDWQRQGEAEDWQRQDTEAPDWQEQATGAHVNNTEGIWTGAAYWQEHSWADYRVETGATGWWDRDQTWNQKSLRADRTARQHQQDPCVDCGAEVTLRSYRDDIGWRCEYCSPDRLACKKRSKGCPHEDFPTKCKKHELYFCPQRTYCNLCREPIPRGTLSAHYDSEHGHVTHSAGSTWRATRSRGSRYTLVTGPAGTALCAHRLTDSGFNLEVFIPVLSERLCEFRCEVRVTQPSTGLTRTYKPDVTYDKWCDWHVNVNKVEFPTWSHELNVIVKISK